MMDDEVIRIARRDAHKAALDRQFKRINDRKGKKYLALARSTQGTCMVCGAFRDDCKCDTRSDWAKMRMPKVWNKVK